VNEMECLTAQANCGYIGGIRVPRKGKGKTSRGEVNEGQLICTRAVGGKERREGRDNILHQVDEDRGA